MTEGEPERVSCPECDGSGRCRYCYGRGHRGYAVAQVEYGSTGRGAECTYCVPAGSGRCARCRGVGRVPKDELE
jgi:hypothetical protein